MCAKLNATVLDRSENIVCSRERHRIPLLTRSGDLPAFGFPREQTNLEQKIVMRHVLDVIAADISVMSDNRYSVNYGQ